MRSPIFPSAGLSTPREPKQTDQAGAHQAAVGLEAFMLRQLLAQVRTGKGMLDGGSGGEMFHDMLDEAMADSMAQAGGIGLAPTIEAALPGGERETPRSSPMLLGALASARAAASYASNAPALTVRPVAGAISSGFGMRTDPIDGTHKAHDGLDLAAPVGAPVVAAGGGKVVRAESSGSYGNLVVVDHGGGLETRYAHLSEIRVRVGDRVAPGDPLGAVGNTGRSTGPHLHFEVRRDGRAIDPETENKRLKSVR